MKARHITKNLVKELEYVLLLAVFLTIPIHSKLNTICIIIWSIVSVFKLKRKEITNLILRKELFFLMFFYLLLIIGVFYSLDIEKGFSKLETQLSILIFTVFLGTKFLKDKFYVKKSLYAFTLGVLLACFICLFNSIITVFQTQKTFIIDEFGRKQSIFFYKNFSEVLDLHPTYLSIFISTAFIFILSQSFLIKKDKFKVLHFIILAFLIVMNFMTASKAGIGSFFVCVSIFLIVRLRFSIIKNIILIFFLLSTFLGLIYFNNVLNTRFKKVFSSVENIISGSEKFNDPVTIRYGLWNLSFKVVKKNIIFGTGTGSVKKLLNQECIEYYFFSDCEKLRKMNAHNQFLEILISNGLVGLILLLLIFFFFFKTSIKSSQLLFFLFLFLIFINMFFESLLQREKGIIFFMAITSLFVAHMYSYNKCLLINER
ncbi:O-antigen ligase family protein [Aquimarina sp. LLG6339-5]|uniref:O-antigen ligase family protein n=1 Tax=Aquimarina sp. LLG6339-5 TaxID=3160830 RepID=UPI00386E80A3